MKLFLDDVRAAPKGWFQAWTASQAIAILANEMVEVASLDHDLGGGPYKEPGLDGLDGMDVVDYMIYNNVIPPRVIIHSHNTYRAKQMFEALNKYKEVTVIYQPYTGFEI